MGKLQILIVDDDPLIIGLVKRVLADRYPCDSAGSAEDARRLLQSTQYEVMMSDIRMPGESGTDLISFVRSTYPQMAVVVISGVEDPHEVKRILDADVYGYIVKPFDPNQVLITLENALRRRKLEMRYREDREHLMARIKDKAEAVLSVKRTCDSIYKSLQDQLAFMHTLIHAIPNPIYYKGIDGRYLGCNEAFGSIFGVSPNGIAGKTVFDVLSPDEAEISHQADLALLKNPGEVTLETTVSSLQGINREVLIKKATYLDAEDKVAGIVGVALDITEQKAMLRKVRESETRLKAIWDSILTGVLVIDERTDAIMDVNPAAVKTIGLNRKEIIGQVASDFICPRQGDACTPGDDESAQSRQESIYLNADGHEVPVIKTISRANIEGHEILINSFLDISDLKAAEKALERSHLEMAALVSRISSIFIGLSASMVIVQWNQVAEKTFGIPASDVLGQLFWDSKIPWDWDSILHGVAECREKERAVSLENMWFQRTDGKDGFLDIRINAVHYEWGSAPGILLMGSDITEKKLLQSQLTQAQKLESIGQLAAGIAHEINTPTQYVGDNTRFFRDAFKDLFDLIGLYGPLVDAVKRDGSSQDLIQGIENHTESISLDYLSEEVPKAVEQTLEGVERISRIVLSMKEFSHPGVDEKTSVDINKALESTVTVARNEWKYVADVKMDLDPDLPWISCYPGELNQVFLNILINGAHAIESVGRKEGEDKGLIRISTQKSGDWVEIRISDTGSGIPESIRHRVFDPFFTTKAVGKGTGQGLAIAHRVIVEMHKGTLGFETVEGRGTTFTIRLPMHSKEEREE
jgi:PAS domain S-box-containing protein